MPTVDELSPSQFRQAIKLGEQIDALRRQLQAILGGARPTARAGGKSRGEPGGKPAKRKMTPEGRARIAAAAKARWAKYRGETAPASTTTKAAASKKKRGTAAAAKAR